MVTHQLQVKRRPGKGRRSQTDVLPLSYTDQPIVEPLSLSPSVNHSLTFLQPLKVTE